MSVEKFAWSLCGAISGKSRSEIGDSSHPALRQSVRQWLARMLASCSQISESRIFSLPFHHCISMVFLIFWVVSDHTFAIRDSQFDAFMRLPQLKCGDASSSASSLTVSHSFLRFVKITWYTGVEGDHSVATNIYSCFHSLLPSRYLFSRTFTLCALFPSRYHGS